MLDQADIAVWQDLYASIIEDADSNILLLDEECRVIHINPGFYWIFYETYGIELKKGTNMLDAMDSVNPRLKHDWKERCVTALSGTPLKVEDVFEIDQRKYYWEIHFKSVITPENVSIISVFSRDITIRKAYQERLVANEANVRSILNTIEESIWQVNTHYELIDFNKAFFKRCKHTYNIKLAKGKNI